MNILKNATIFRVMLKRKLASIIPGIFWCPYLLYHTSVHIVPEFSVLFLSYCFFSQTMSSLYLSSIQFYFTLFFPSFLYVLRSAGAVCTTMPFLEKTMVYSDKYIQLKNLFILFMDTHTHIFPPKIMLTVIYIFNALNTSINF